MKNYNVKSKITFILFTLLIPALVQADTVGPVISQIQEGSMSSSSITISWVTDEPSTSQIEYGQTESFGKISSTGGTLSLTHSIALVGLTPETRYYYRIRSKDAAGNETITRTFNFMILKEAPVVLQEPFRIMRFEVYARTEQSIRFVFATPIDVVYSVEYAKTPTFSPETMKKTEFTKVYSLNHVSELTGLEPGTLYYFLIRSKDRSGKEYLSQYYTFTTVMSAEQKAKKEEEERKRQEQKPEEKKIAEVPQVFKRPLYFGLWNDPDVLKLQEALRQLGYYKGRANGNFGPVTRAALQRFQRANNIWPLGRVGPHTRARLNQLVEEGKITLAP